jgi:acyl-CoA synthetase (AMP-forming)/AMP-acid ligase II
MKSLPIYETGKVYQLSPEGLQQLPENIAKSKHSGQYVLWTDDKKVELPIRMGTTGPSAIPPTTLIDEWKTNLNKFATSPALSVKRGEKWVTQTFQQYHDESMRFARSLVALNIPEFASVIITGFNAPEWLIAFHGAAFARCIPVGVYSTNSKDICEYIVKDSDAKVVIAETMAHAAKYTDLLKDGAIERIAVYND